MLPPQIASSAPSSERLLFHKLKEDPATRGWVVFHSFDIRRHVSRAQGEADLVVLVPDLGVLCIEVKGCGVRRKDGLWTYEYSPPETSTVGPFKQASGAAHSVRNYLSGRDATLGGIVFTSAVFFTQIDFAERSLEWEPWQVVGKSDLLRVPVSALVTRVLNAEHSRLKGLAATRAWYGSRSRPNEGQISAMASMLRRDFEYAAAGSDSVELVEASIRRFTEEQFQALDLLHDNRRVLFKGPAGTGKTLLAIETARREVRAGGRVVLLCHNAILGGWLRHQTESIAAEARASGRPMVVGTLSSLMLRISGIEIPLGAGSDFWSRELPSRALDVLLDGRSSFPPCDLLVIDEAQDLMSDEFLDILELITVGGLAGGRWAMFGDFERQAIYANANAAPGLERVRARAAPGFATYPLRINCRNTRSIAAAVTLASGLAPGYARVLQSEEGSDVIPTFFRKMDDQVERLRDALARMLRKHDANSVVVLSMRKDQHACALRLGKSFNGIPVLPFEAPGSPGVPSIRFGSVHAYKGMESPAVILTDIDEIEGDQARALLYVGMTRARLDLLMLMNERLRSSYGQLLTAGLRVQREIRA